MKYKFAARGKFMLIIWPFKLSELCRSGLQVQACDILTVLTLSLQGLVITVHMSFLQLVDQICYLTEAMIDKTFAFNFCHNKSPLPFILI